MAQHMIYPIITISAHRIRLTMDSHDASTVYGDLVGTIVGNIGFSPGIKGDAANFWHKTSYIDYGIHPAECFHAPKKCTNGVTFAMWIKPSTIQPKAMTMVLDTGGNYMLGLGYVIGFDTHKKYGGIGMEVKTARVRYANTQPLQTGLWSHVIFTWSENNLILIYTNGCLAKTHDPDFWTEIQLPPTDVVFSLGASSTTRAGYPTCSMLLDEFIVWHVVLSPDQVWQLFQQGGVV